MSRRGTIVLSPEEQLDLLESQRVVVISSPDGPPMEVWIWTYAKSQKVRNLERDPRATLLVETGEEYLELRGVQLECEVEVIRETERVAEFGKQLTVRYADGIDSIEGDAAAALEAQAAKRVAIRFQPVRAASWDHRKLGGTY